MNTNVDSTSKCQSLIIANRPQPGGLADSSRWLKRSENHRKKSEKSCTTKWCENLKESLFYTPLNLAPHSGCNHFFKTLSGGLRCAATTGYYLRALRAERIRQVRFKLEFNPSKYLRTYLLWFGLIAGLQPMPAFAQSKSNSDATTSQQQTLKQPDGQHDFDFEIGTWKTHLRRLLRPLTGSTTWVEYEGTTVVRKVWNGRANLVELVADGPAGHFEGLNLRLYNPQSRQWSLNFASSSSGSLGIPTIGEFKNGRGEFYDQETLNGRAIFVRFVISDITPNSCRFEQAFSDDGGKTWEVNWIAVDTRVKE